MYVHHTRLQESERKSEEYKAALTQALSDLQSMRCVIDWDNYSILITALELNYMYYACGYVDMQSEIW